MVNKVVVLGSLSTFGVFAVIVALIGGVVMLLARWFGRSSIEIARSVSSCKGPVIARVLEEEHAVLSIRSFKIQVSGIMLCIVSSSSLSCDRSCGGQR